MEILTSTGTTYPRIGRNSVGHKLRWAFPKFDRGEIDRSAISLLQSELIREIIKEQEEAGIDIVIDGQVRRYCPVSHFAGNLEGVEIGSLHHYFDTNFHVRKAVIKGLPQWVKPVTVDEFVYASGITGRKVKIVLPSVELLTRYSDNQSRHSSEEIRDAYSKAIQKEVEALKKAGCEFIYLDDQKGRYIGNYNILQVVDGRSKMMENPRRIAKNIKAMVRPGINILEPNWGLEALPRRYARQKLEILTAVKELLI